MTINGKSILITGGTSGIGAASTRYFAELGARVVCASNQRNAGETLDAELRAGGRDVTFIEVDISSEESVRALCRKMLEHYQRIDGVFCNAGVWGKGRVTDFVESDWNRIMGVKVKGPS